DRNRTDRDNNERRSGKPTNRSQDSNRPNKPAAKRVGGTLGLKK
ncbi:23S rRNA pseudouridine(2604) synthase RluF, partial [Vibrio cyclitrophicus]